MIRFATLAMTLLLAAGAVQAEALDGRLKKIAAAKTIVVAYRTDASPFSFAGTAGKPVGFSVDLCTRVVNSIGDQIKVPDLKIKWVQVTSQTRLDAVAKGRADMECGASTVTLSRLKQVDFSNYIFVETTGLLIRADSDTRSFPDLAGKKIAVIADTTNERAINAQLKRRQITATVLPMKSREEALAALEGGDVDAFASDKLLLIGAASKAKDPKALALLGDELSFEPYGIVLPRGDASLRLAVNTGLSQIYGSGEIAEIFKHWFASLGRASAMVEAGYILGTIPE